MESKTAKIADSKEEYVARKKALAAKVRTFTKSFLSSEDEIDTARDLSDWPNQCKLLIQDFKSEFDFLAESAKYSELCFLAVYKVLRELSDPRDIICNCLTVCLLAHEGLKHATEQLHIASANLAALQPSATEVNRGLSSSAFGATTSMEEFHRVSEQFEKEKRINDTLQNEMADLRSRLVI